MVVDAQNMHQFEDSSLDIVTCCYGFMFCPEPLKVFVEKWIGLMLIGDTKEKKFDA